MRKGSDGFCETSRKVNCKTFFKKINMAQPSALLPFCGVYGALLALLNVHSMLLLLYRIFVLHKHTKYLISILKKNKRVNASVEYNVQQRQNDGPWCASQIAFGVTNQIRTKHTQKKYHTKKN